MKFKRDYVIMLCTGNICQPMAEKLLQHALAAEEAPLNQIQVVSAGIAADFLKPGFPKPESLKPGRFDLTRHRSQPLTDSLLDRAFVVFAMTQSHLDASYVLPDVDSDVRLHLFRVYGTRGSGRNPRPFRCFLKLIRLVWTNGGSCTVFGGF